MGLHLKKKKILAGGAAEPLAPLLSAAMPSTTLITGAGEEMGAIKGKNRTMEMQERNAWTNKQGGL